MSVKLIPVRNSVREEKRKKGDGEWDFFFLLVVVLFWASQVALVVKNLPTNAGDVRDAGSIPTPRVRKIPRSRKWQPTSVFWLGESFGQRSLGSHKGSDMTKHPPVHSTIITPRIMTILAINSTPSGWRRHKLSFQKNKTDEESCTPSLPTSSCV